MLLKRRNLRHLGHIVCVTVLAVPQGYKVGMGVGPAGPTTVLVTDGQAPQRTGFVVPEGPRFTPFAQGPGLNIRQCEVSQSTFSFDLRLLICRLLKGQGGRGAGSASIANFVCPCRFMAHILRPVILTRGAAP